ncbi:hypothetical protein M8C21_005891 [Ambrosia artemisiifolia]|uniref:Uncharacterized protein n=1 Tax=Ambrosia artemisiifolia TaxID=4212 RepID=A0AAD5CUG1_AMBAR|nr:hypothetical protein M8C21_005891 [Ambrosia artemisiifolia]
MGVFTVPPFTMTMSELSAKMKDIFENERFQQRAKGALYTATLSQEIWRVESVLNKSFVTLRDKITINGNTALHVAVGTSKNKEFLEKMLNHGDLQPLDMVNSEGSTLLHIAAIVGNTKVAKMLIENNRDLLVTKDNANQTPLARALSNMHKDTYLYLWNSFFSTPDVEAGVLFDSTDGCKLLVNLISSKDYGSAMYLIHHHKETFLRHIDTMLIAIAQDFPPKLNFWERTIHKSLLKYRFVEGNHTAYWLAKMLLKQICSLIKEEIPSESHHGYYKNAILEAARQNADKLVKIIVSEFPNAIWSTNEEGHNIIQYAVINRSERVYNLVYQMSEHKNIYRTIQEDTSGNNLLHLAARLAPPEKLDHISGAALRIQHELQWFKEVERFVCPLNIIQKNKNR